MQKKIIFSKNDLMPLSLILILVFARLIPHLPNFTPIIAVAIMSGYFFRNMYVSFSVLLISMIIGDFFIGFYNNMVFVYLALLFISFVCFKKREKVNFKNLFIFGISGSLIFYLISNFGVWMLTDMYEKNLEGLIYCYFLAIPFFTNTLLSTIIFSYAAYLANSYFSKRVIQ